ncbi:MAG: DMT family transporter [Pseudomonadota bacterium]
MGAGFAVAASLVLVVMDTFVKLAGQELPVPQLLWARYFFHLATIVVFIPFIGWSKVVRTRQPVRQWSRGLCVALSSLFAFNAFQALPLTDVYAIGFTAPLIVTILAIPFLGEQVGPRRWAAVFVGLLGVLVVIRPGLETVNTGMMFAIVMAFMFACYQLLTRSGALQDGPLVGVFYAAVVGTIGTSLFVPFAWVAPTPLQWAILILIGVLGAAGHWLLIMAFRSAAASFVSPFMYVQIIWSTIFGALVFADNPDPYTLLGAAILIGAGIFVLWRETVVAKRAP